MDGNNQPQAPDPARFDPRDPAQAAEFRRLNNAYLAEFYKQNNAYIQATVQQAVQAALGQLYRR